MAYIKACIPIARYVGQELSQARIRRDAKIASANLLGFGGLKAQRNARVNMAHAEFERTKKRLLEYMEVNGCL